MANLAYRKLRAPSQDTTALVDPPIGQVPALVAINKDAANRCVYDCQGRGMQALRAEVRSELLTAALAYTSQYSDAAAKSESPAEANFLLAGHQPELFHAGVWYKNFLLSSLARQERAVAINLIVDSDTCRRTAIAVPTANSHAVIESIPFDVPADPQPFEERAVLDDNCFRSFGIRVSKQFVGQGFSPLLGPVWQAAVAARQRKPEGGRLGLLLAEARHVVEQRAGIDTLELPLSRVCGLRSFRWFAVHLLSELPSLSRIYNEVLLEYRLVNRIRSAAHPVPELTTRDGWQEAPFYLWSSAEPRRRRVFVRRTPEGLELSDWGSRRLRLHAKPGRSPQDAIDQLEAAEAAGIKLRPRALITTMFSRLLASDLFIHGIGGAKYDELTDGIIRRFFGVDPPRYLTATATFRLPIERPLVSQDDVRSIAARMRDLKFRPESFIDDWRLASEPALRGKLQELAAEKREYLARHRLRRAPADVYRGLDQINQAMQAVLQPLADQLRTEQERLTEKARIARLLGSREFSFVLFPGDQLIARLLELSKAPA